VLVKVGAASLNPIDYKKMGGALYLLEAVTGDLRSGGGSTPGFDLAGTVVAAGTDCKRVREGDEVFAMAQVFHTGALAEYVSVPEAMVSIKPPRLSMEEAASIPMAALTSLQALRTYGKLAKGEHVVVLGGSGGCGSQAVQIAKALGAGWVTATASPRNAALVKSLGANRVVNYRTEDWAEEVLKDSRKGGGGGGGGGSGGIPAPVLVIDTVGGRGEWERAQRVLGPGGRFVTIAGDHQVRERDRGGRERDRKKRHVRLTNRETADRI
jgi:NADPH:quinone reductase-like Zn-dependent oxidoreductase